MFHLYGSPLGDRLREGDVYGLGLFQSDVEDVRRFGGALLHADLAAHALVPVDHGGFLADIDGEVAHVARDLLDLAVGHEGDVLVLRAVHHARREDAGRAVDGGEGLVQLGHDPADRGLLLHDGDLETGVGQIECRLDAGHPAADDEDVLVDVDLVRIEGLEQAGLGHRHLDDVPGLLGRDGHVGVDPGAVLPDVGHLEEVGVEAAVLAAAPEGHLVHVGRAGGHDHPVELLVLDGLLDGGLTRLGARVHGVVGVHDVLEGQRPFGESSHIDGAGDVGAAMADEDADPHGCASSCAGRRRRRGSRLGDSLSGRLRRFLSRRLRGLGCFLGSLLGRLALFLGPDGQALIDGPLDERRRVHHVLFQQDVVDAQTQGDPHAPATDRGWARCSRAEGFVDLTLLEVQVHVAERASHHDGLGSGGQRLLDDLAAQPALDLGSWACPRWLRSTRSCSSTTSRRRRQPGAAGPSSWAARCPSRR